LTDFRFQILGANDPKNCRKCLSGFIDEMRFVAKFGENRPLRSSRTVVWITAPKKNSGSGDLSQPAPILPKKVPMPPTPQFLERCHPLACPRIPKLVRIGCVLLAFSGKVIFRPKKSIQYRLSAYIKERYLTSAVP